MEYLPRGPVADLGTPLRLPSVASRSVEMNREGEGRNGGESNDEERFRAAVSKQPATNEDRTTHDPRLNRSRPGGTWRTSETMAARSRGQEAAARFAQKVRVHFLDFRYY